MSAPVLDDSLFDSTPWNPVAVICRRMCLLMVLGKPEAAERVRLLELPPALAAAGWTEEAEAYRSLYQAEEVRAREAAALAERLAPLLTAGPVSRAARTGFRVADIVPFAATEKTAG